ncbi:MAG: carboxylating nicotinate-nucleotide diphosphorylase [Cyclonatronaceae bacterium]
MNKHIQAIVDIALHEDIGRGDITTSAIFCGSDTATAVFTAKQAGVLAGISLAGYIFSEVDPSLVFSPKAGDGTPVQKDEVIAEVSGQAASILTAERTVLNFMQRMSGIATKTNRFCEAIADYPTQLLDTRKTAPGQRYLDKWAVRLGGGTNHRFCLDDMYLIKENHISVAGGITQALQTCAAHREQKGLQAKIEIEVENMAQLAEVLQTGIADVVLLDNMSNQQLAEAVQKIDGRLKTEASGNMTMRRAPEVAATGVNYISVGSITHSVTAMDISLRFS